NPRDFDPAKDRYLNRSAFATPASFAIGDTARANDWARGWTQKSESLSVIKDIRIKESVRAELGADIINPFNFVRWGNPNTDITSGNFGKVTTLAQAGAGAGSGGGGSGAGGRTVQLNARIRF